MPEQHRTATPDDRSSDPLADPDEVRVLSAALDSFKQYRRAAHYNVTHLRRQSFYALPARQVELLSAPPFSIPKTFDAVDEAIEANAIIAEAIFDVGTSTFGLNVKDGSWKGQATPSDLDKARSTIRQLYRDWSEEGRLERHASYSPILEALEEHFSSVPTQRHRHHVLVPGAGLGRLVFEICLAGYTVEGNEISYHQLLASNFVLNYTTMAQQFRLYPWALSFINHHSRANQLQAVMIPDIHPGALAATSNDFEVSFGERMSMSSGDFCVLYRQPGHKHTFDAVATCFFIDTAPNLISYIETISHCLRPGGLWINLGPLLWHFDSALTPAERDKQRGQNARKFSDDHEGIGEPGSFELTNDEVIALLAQYEFDIIEKKDVPAGATGYIQDPASMLQNVYRPAFWIARKKCILHVTAISCINLRHVGRCIFGNSYTTSTKQSLHPTFKQPLPPQRTAPTLETFSVSRSSQSESPDTPHSLVLHLKIGRDHAKRLSAKTSDQSCAGKAPSAMLRGGTKRRWQPEEDDPRIMAKKIKSESKITCIDLTTGSDDDAEAATPEPPEQGRVSLTQSGLPIFPTEGDRGQDKQTASEQLPDLTVNATPASTEHDMTSKGERPTNGRASYYSPPSNLSAVPLPRADQAPAMSTLQYISTIKNMYEALRQQLHAADTRVKTQTQQLTNGSRLIESQHTELRVICAELEATKKDRGTTKDELEKYESIALAAKSAIKCNAGANWRAFGKRMNELAEVVKDAEDDGIL